MAKNTKMIIARPQAIPEGPEHTKKIHKILNYEERQVLARKGQIRNLFDRFFWRGAGPPIPACNSRTWGHYCGVIRVMNVVRSAEPPIISLLNVKRAAVSWQ